MIEEQTSYITLADQDFNEKVLQSSKTVLVDLWAPWCGPCQTMNPIVEELASIFEGQIIVGKVNVDEQPQTAAQFNIRSIPTFLIFQDGKVVETITGAVSKKVLIEKIQDALNAI